MTSKEMTQERYQLSALRARFEHARSGDMPWTNGHTEALFREIDYLQQECNRRTPLSGDEQAEAWEAVWEKLRAFNPNFYSKGRNGEESALMEIERLQRNLGEVSAAYVLQRAGAAHEPCERQAEIDRLRGALLQLRGHLRDYFPSRGAFISPSETAVDFITNVLDNGRSAQPPAVGKNQPTSQQVGLPNSIDEIRQRSQRAVERHNGLTQEEFDIAWLLNVYSRSTKGRDEKPRHVHLSGICMLGCPACAAENR